ncbi:hypothetical protein [Myxococcus stipitatus]|uniref:hypothetical protein n=1 Tax=Myxococcus stipitatus TaxID=83455 RepID=UPI0030D36B8C
MRAEDLLTDAPSAEAVARETEKLPEVSAETRESLRRALESSAQQATPAPWPTLLLEARGKMDSRYAGPVTSHRGGISGPALVLAKRAFRLLFQPFINEALRKQVEFNESILDALATIHDVQREHARTHATWRQDVERRLARMEEAARARGSHEATDTEAALPRASTSASPNAVAPSSPSTLEVPQTERAAAPRPGADTGPQGPPRGPVGGTSRRRSGRR